MNTLRKKIKEYKNITSQRQQNETEKRKSQELTNGYKKKPKEYRKKKKAKDNQVYTRGKAKIIKGVQEKGKAKDIQMYTGERKDKKHNKEVQARYKELILQMDTLLF